MMNEQDKKIYFEKVNQQLHLIGRILLVVSLSTLIAIPYLFGGILDAYPSLKDFWLGFANVAIIYYPVALVEFIVFAPMLGVGGSYLAYLTGNLKVCLFRAASLKPTEAVRVKLDFHVDQRAKDYGEILGEMIRCETISSRENYDLSKIFRFHQMLEKLFPLVHTNCERTEIDGNLLFKWSGSGNGEPILWMSHQDVVEATGKWEHDPFGGELIGDAVWGRGTVDTKGNLFCIMQSVEEMIRDGYVPPCDVYIASSCTEEITGDGAPKLVQHLKDNGVRLRMTLDEGGMIMEEPIAGLKGTYAVIGVLEKGHGNMKFIARSHGGHASAPRKNTPLARLAAFINEVEQHDPFQPKMNATVEEMFKRFAPNMGFGMRFLIANLWLFRPLVTKLLPKVSSLAGAMVKTTIAFTTAKGSDGLNVLPQEAYVTGNMRFIHHQGTDESVAIMTEIAKKYEIEAHLLNADYPCPVADFRSEEFQLVEQTVGELFPGVGVSPYAMTGGTDSKHYKDVCDNCLRFAPLYISQQQYKGIHGLNENIDMAALVKGVDFYKALVQKF